jgi:hypothetical protein
MNVHWIALYKLHVCCSDMKFKMYVLPWWSSWISDRHEKHKLCEDLPMIIPGQFGFNCPSGFREEAF